jgi:MEDS: MEthanogen/methylotroph, DcmR Sensory domain
MRETMMRGGEHVVQFYDQQEDLARAVGDYLSAAVAAREIAIVIATEQHRLRFEAEMARAGTDTAMARRDGSIIWLDAA